jgi:VWFA-related protein
MGICSFYLRLGVLGALTVMLPAQQPPVIRTNVPLVLVPVAVADRKGHPIDGLDVNDFVVTDDGIQQRIQMDTSDTIAAPVSLVVAVQSSDISAAALAKIRRVGGMIQPLIAGERGRAAVITFDEEVRTLQEFTSDSTKIGAAFKGIQMHSIKTGKMIDAVAQGVRMLSSRPQNSRRVLITIGESRDRGSQTKLPQAVESAQRAGVIVYSMTYSVHATPWTAKPEDTPPPADGGGLMGVIEELIRLGKTNDAEVFAQETGGRHFSFLTLKSLEEIITQAGVEIHSQYLLSFAPAESANAGFHRLEVTVPSKPDIVVRARPGYWP